MSQQNRHKIKQWFLTFPKSGDITKQEFINSLTEFGCSEFAKCVEETHKDGTKHLHAIYKFQDGVTKTSLLNYFRSEFPNDWKRIHVEPVRSMLKAQKYIDKEDPSPYVVGEYKESRGRKKSNLKEQIAQEMSKELFVKMKSEDIDEVYLAELQDEILVCSENSENSDYSDFLKKKLRGFQKNLNIETSHVTFS